MTSAATHTANGVTYRADIYCIPCAVRLFLERAGLEGHGLSHDPLEALELLGRFHLPHGAWMEQREHEWDSDDFPKLLPAWHDPETCGGCGETIYDR